MPRDEAMNLFMALGRLSPDEIGCHLSLKWNTQERMTQKERVMEIVLTHVATEYGHFQQLENTMKAPDFDFTHFLLLR